MADSRRASKLRSLRLEAAMNALLAVSITHFSGRNEKAGTITTFLGFPLANEGWGRHPDPDLARPL